MILTKTAYFFLVVVFISTKTANAECWDEAARMYDHDPLLLKAIAWKETKGYVESVGIPLKDGNRAIGLMQINTIHLPELQKYGITKQHLMNACVSEKVGAWVLAKCMSKYGRSWRAVGCYYGGENSKAYKAMNAYAMDVRKYYEGYKRKQNKLIDNQKGFSNVSLQD